jgi:hypothetical protein
MPNSVKYFEWISLGSLVLGIINSALAYSTIVAPGTEVFAGIVQFFTFGILLMLILLISRKRSNIAKWLWIIMFALGNCYLSCLREQQDCRSL